MLSCELSMRNYVYDVLFIIYYLLCIRNKVIKSIVIVFVVSLNMECVKYIVVIEILVISVFDFRIWCLNFLFIINRDCWNYSIIE